jgi:peptidoglycan/xylan/chitin deacetylase (PgdA/CDA1 family)
MPVRAWLRAVLSVVLALGPPGGLVASGHPGWALAWLLVALAVAWHLLPDLDLPGRTVRRGPRGGGRIALTFDDGPNGEATRVILDVLAAHGAKATFFCVGEAARAQPGLVRRMVAEGHEVGNHTLGHALLPRLPRAAVRREVAGAQRALIDAGAPPPRLFRAPKGFKSVHLPATLRGAGLRLGGWTRGVWDTVRPGVAEIVRRARPALRDGHILLLHDGLPGLDRTQTALALGEILALCRRRGLTPVTVAQLLGMPERLGAA